VVCGNVGAGCLGGGQLKGHAEKGNQSELHKIYK
jgi:hypothetical protein